jgi:hypothetical protein
MNFARAAPENSGFTQKTEGASDRMILAGGFYDEHTEIKIYDRV